LTFSPPKRLGFPASDTPKCWASYIHWSRLPCQDRSLVSYFCVLELRHRLDGIFGHPW
jgi:hypothetical protein